MKKQNAKLATAFIRSICGVAFPLLMLLIGAPTTAAEITGDPRVDPIPTLDSDSQDKAIVVGLDFLSAMDVELRSVEVVKGPARGRAGDPQLLTVDLLDLDNNVVETFNAWHPLWLFTFDEVGQDQLTVLPQGTGYMAFAFRSDIATMQLSDAEAGQTLISVDLIPDLHEFCRENPDDADCADIVNRPPSCDADGPYVAECAGATTTVGLDGSGSIDPDGDPLTYSWTGPFGGGTASGVSPAVVFSGLGDFEVGLTVADDWGGAAACSTTVTVQDTTAPEAACNAPATIVPPDAPVSFTATATDVCGSVSVAITGYDCYTYTKKGKRIDKTDSCVVAVSGDSISILDSGGVGDNITWTIEATDSSGNRTVENCNLSVIRP